MSFTLNSRATASSRETIGSSIAVASCEEATQRKTSFSDASLLAAHARRRSVFPQRLRDPDRPVLLLEVLHQRDPRACSHRRAVQRVDVLELPLVAVADVETARLIVRRVRGRCDLAVPLLSGEPGFDVVLPRRRRAEVPGGDV